MSEERNNNNKRSPEDKKWGPKTYPKSEGWITARYDTAYSATEEDNIILNNQASSNETNKLDTEDNNSGNNNNTSTEKEHPWGQPQETTSGWASLLRPKRCLDKAWLESKNKPWKVQREEEPEEEEPSEPEVQDFTWIINNKIPREAKDQRIKIYTIIEEGNKINKSSDKLVPRKELQFGYFKFTAEEFKKEVNKRESELKKVINFIEEDNNIEDWDDLFNIIWVYRYPNPPEPSSLKTIYKSSWFEKQDHQFDQIYGPILKREEDLKINLELKDNIQEGSAKKEVDNNNLLRAKCKEFENKFLNGTLFEKELFKVYKLNTVEKAKEILIKARKEIKSKFNKKNGEKEPWLFCSWCENYIRYGIELAEIEKFNK